MNKIIHFIKYNNFTILIILAIFLLGSGVFAQTETGQALIGEQETTVEGVDNTLLLTVDLATHNMDFKIEKIEEDAKYFYVTYTYLDIDIVNNAWQYDLKEKVRKISKRSGEDVAVYMAEEFKEIYDTRLQELLAEQIEAQATGEEKRVEVTAYSGLIGKTLDLAGQVFPGYEPVQTTELPSPETFALPGQEGEENSTVSPADNLTSVYQKYMDAHDQDGDKVLDTLDNCPTVANPDQLDSNNDDVGDACPASDSMPPFVKGDEGGLNDSASPETPDQSTIEPSAEIPSPETITEPETVEIIDLPAEPAPTAETTETAPVVETPAIE
jgi:hypothetical protein